MSIRKQHNSGFKAQVALEAIKNQNTIAEIASENGVHPSQVNKWKKQALDGLPGIFSGKHDNGKQDSEKLQAELYQQIGQLKVELDWLKKKVGYLG
jgi:putative transposase